jgi:ATP-dependent Clp protease protease subunit
MNYMETEHQEEGHEPSTAEPRNAFLEEKAFKSRTVMLFGEISDKSAADIARRLIALDADSNKPIDLIVSSPGGHLESGDAIHDIIRFITAPVNMIGTGWVGSAATHLYLSVPKERRFCTPNTRFLIHQPSGGAGGPASDIAIHAQEIIKARERIARAIARETGKPYDTVLNDIERDRWLSAEEAIEYGILGRIIQSKNDIKR